VSGKVYPYANDAIGNGYMSQGGLEWGIWWGYGTKDGVMYCVEGVEGVEGVHFMM